ncbi:hypothetical protein K8R43_04105 [archaeon]|nr:hypothetical protein [archaeon]
MNPFLLTIAIAFFGLLFNAQWLFLLGALGLIITALFKLTAKPIRAPAGGTVVSHKLMQAPIDAWDEENIATYMTALGGQRTLTMGNMDDPFKVLSDSSKGSVPADLIRNRLPFSNYGRESLFEHFFIGLPINMGTLFRKK